MFCSREILEKLDHIHRQLETLENKMSQLSDAVDALTTNSTALTTAVGANTEASQAVAADIDALKTQLANDDTAGVAAAVTVLGTVNSNIASAVSSLNASTAALTQLAPATSGA